LRHYPATHAGLGVVHVIHIAHALRGGEGGPRDPRAGTLLAELGYD